MKCPFRKYEAVVDARKEVIFGNCYMENCMAYRLTDVAKNESVCYCALMATPPIPYVFRGCYDGNN